ncbi:hypothetical protein Aperf_G00000105525 [Anoplocephala perfoliata]
MSRSRIPPPERRVTGETVTRRLSLNQDAEALISASAAANTKPESEGISEEFSDVIHAIGEMEARLARQRQPSATVFIVEALTLARDGGILDWDDRVCDVLDDREMSMATTKNEKLNLAPYNPDHSSISKIQVGFPRDKILQFFRFHTSAELQDCTYAAALQWRISGSARILIQCTRIYQYPDGLPRRFLDTHFLGGQFESSVKNKRSCATDLYPANSFSNQPRF